MAQPPRTRTRARMLGYFSLSIVARVEIASEPAVAATGAEGLAPLTSSAEAARGPGKIESARSARHARYGHARPRQIPAFPAVMLAPRLSDSRDAMGQL